MRADFNSRGLAAPRVVFSDLGQRSYRFEVAGYDLTQHVASEDELQLSSEAKSKASVEPVSCGCDALEVAKG